MFPIDKRLITPIMYPAPDVVPQVLFAVDAAPNEVWNSTDDLYELADAIEPYLKEFGAKKWDFIWSMERHFSEPYGPLPKAQQSFMAGIPDMFLGTATTSDSGEASDYAPLSIEADSEIDPEYRAWLEKLMYAHGECMMPYFGEKAKGQKSMFASLDEWMIENAPDAETRLRIQNFVSEEYKHQYQFYKVYQEFSEDMPFRIYEHEQNVFRAYQSMVVEGTWIDKSINNMLSDRFGVYQGFEWVESSYAPLARVSLAVVKDERGHSNMGYLAVRNELERHGEDARREVQRRVDEYWYPYFMAAFGSDDSENNVKWRQFGLKRHTNAELRSAYDTEVRQVLDSLGVVAPDATDALEQGRAAAKKARSGATN